MINTINAIIPIFKRITIQAGTTNAIGAIITFNVSTPISTNCNGIRKTLNKPKRPFHDIPKLAPGSVRSFIESLNYP